MGQQFQAARVVLQTNDLGVRYAEPDQAAMVEVEVACVDDLVLHARVLVIAVHAPNTGLVVPLDLYAPFVCPSNRRPRPREE